jgi:two-component system sensor histidine kinase BaeS
MGILQNKADAKNIVLEYEFQNWEDSQLIYHDEQRISQILLNLQSNAIKFTEGGSVKVSVSKNEEFLNMSVKDSGVGISQDNQ